MNNCGKFFSSPLVPLTPRAMKVNISDYFTFVTLLFTGLLVYLTSII